MRRYALRRPHRRVHRSRDTAPVARAPGGGARPDRSYPSRRIRARHRWGGALRAVDPAPGPEGAGLWGGGRWTGLLAVFAVVFGVGGAWAFGPLIEEAT